MEFIDYFESLIGDKNSYVLRDDIDLEALYFHSNIFDHLERNSKLHFKNKMLTENIFKDIIFKNIDIYFTDIQIFNKLFISGIFCNVYFKSVTALPDDGFDDEGDKVFLNLNGYFPNINIRNINLKRFEISISGILDELIFRECMVYEIIIYGSIIDKIWLLSVYELKQYGNIKNIRIKDVNIDFVDITGLWKTENIIFDSSTINKSLNIQNSLITNLLKFDTYKVYELILFSSKVNNIKIDLKDENFLESDKLKFVSPNIFSIQSNDTKINYFELNQSNEIELCVFSLNSVDKLQITNLICRNFYLNNTIKESSLILGCVFENITFQNFYSLSNLSIKGTNLKPNFNFLTIIDSHLDNTVISPSFFEQLENIKFFNSSIQNLKLTNFTDIPYNTLNPIDRDNETNYLILYREFKELAKNYGDNYLFHKFKALEYNERLKGGLDFLDRSVLKFNQFTNNHTTDWLKAFKLFFIISFSYLSLLLTYLYFSYPNFELLQASKILPYLVSPVSFLMHYKDFEFHNAIYIIDFFYNLAIGLILYQMIAAFRKFNR